MKRKIISSLAVLCAITVVQGVVFLFLLNYINRTEDSLDQANEMQAQIYNIEMQHYKWLQGLTLHLYTGSEFTGSLDHTACGLGSWLSTPDLKEKGNEQFGQLVDDIVAPHKIIHDSAGQILERIEAGDNTGAETVFNTNVLPNLESTISLLDQIAGVVEADKEAMAQTSDNAMKLSYLLLGGTLVFSILCGVLLVVFMVKMIIPPLQIITRSAKELSIGNVDLDIPVHSRDELGDLATAFREMASEIRHQAEMLDKISQGDYTGTIAVRSDVDVMNKAINHILDRNNEMVWEIRSSAEQVASGSEQIANSAQVLANGSTEQAATLAQFTESLSAVQDKAEQTMELAKTTVTEVLEVGRLMGESTAYMEKMTEAMRLIEESSQSISKVIKVIDDIAFQTNILALNAAVEAARAGQHGKGFAVVADEVRNLASKSAAAARETSTLIASSVENVSIGSGVVEKTGKSIAKVGEIAVKNAEAMQMLSDSSREQSAAIAEINVGIDQLNSVVQANSATAEESAASAQEMSAQSHLLQNVVSRFKLRRKGAVVSALPLPKEDDAAV